MLLRSDGDVISSKEQMESHQKVQVMTWMKQGRDMVAGIVTWHL
jgi:hypothetical protein